MYQLYSYAAMMVNIARYVIIGRLFAAVPPQQLKSVDDDDDF